jgi:hypothetical protein
MRHDRHERLTVDHASRRQGRGNPASIATCAPVGIARQLDRASVLFLQRSAGNRATVRLLQRNGRGGTRYPSQAELAQLLQELRGLEGAKRVPVQKPSRLLEWMKRSPDWLRRAALVIGADISAASGGRTIDIPETEKPEHIQELEQGIEDKRRAEGKKKGGSSPPKGRAAGGGMTGGTRYPTRAEQAQMIRELNELTVAQPVAKPPAPGTPPGGSGGATSKVVTQAEEALVESGAQAGEKLGMRALKGFGRFLLEVGIPGPDDAIMMLGDFAGSYAEAWKAMEKRGLQRGFAAGFAAQLLRFDPDWVRERLAYRFANRSMATNLVGGRGKEERKFNEGLARGYFYGQRHSAQQAATVREGAFAALARSGRSIGTSSGFDVDDVWRVASVLVPTANAVIAEAERRMEKRLMKELAKKMGW